MEAKITCSVINDLLPLYADNALSRDSRALVEEHLEGCKFCTAELEGMKKPIVITNDTDNKHIKKLTERVSIKRFITVTLLALFSMAFILWLGFGLGTMHLDSLYGSKGELMNYFALSLLILLLFSSFWYWLLYMISFIRRITGKAKWKTQTVRRVCTSSALTLISVYIIVTAGYFLLFYGAPAKYDDLEFNTEFQYSQDSLLEQAWVIHVSSRSGKPINVFRQEMYNKDRQVVGIIYTVHEIPIKSNLMTSEYTMGYSYGNDTPEDLPEDFDFTVIIDLKGKSVTYSMRDEGLFKKQDNVLYSPDSPNQEQKHDPQNITARTAANGEDTYVYD